jgi:four helix bundle protein
VGANYRAACRGRSKAEFIAKIGVVEEEADECGYRIELIIEGELLKKDLVQPLLDETNALTKMMARSRITASDHRRAESSDVTAARKSNRQSAIGNRQ